MYWICDSFVLCEEDVFVTLIATYLLLLKLFRNFVSVK